MKNVIITLLAAVSFSTMTGNVAHANESDVITLECGDDPVCHALAAALTALQLCENDKSTSCTEELETAGQNLIDYVRLKKNPLKAIERNWIRRPAKEIERTAERIGKEIERFVKKL